MNLFRREDRIARLCRESGRWRLVEREGERYHVVADDGSALQAVWLRYREAAASVLFQSRFPVRFSLENPPSGLFGRLLMRNFMLVYAHWAIDLGEASEAIPWVVARVPMAGFDARLFDAVCREIRDEIESFHRELKDKFRYGVEGVMPDGGGMAADDRRSAQPVPDGRPPAEWAWRTLPDAEAWRIIQDQAGPRRYRLPGPRE